MTIATRLVDANGLTFEVLTAGSGPRLALCLHGFPEHASSWRHQLPLLADHGYTAWAPNLRGYGRSSRPPRVGDYALEHLMDDVAGLIDASGCEEVVLLAHDWGGVIAWHFAMRRLRPLDKLVVMNLPHPEPAAREIRQNPMQRRSSWYIAWFQLPFLPEYMMLRAGPEGFVKLFADTAAHPDRFTAGDLAPVAEQVRQRGNLTAMVNYYRALVRGGGAARQRALGSPVIDVPTLLLWGEADMALTKATTYGTEAWVDDLTLRYLPGISHWVQQDAPGTVNAMLGAFLRGEEVPEGLLPEDVPPAQ